MSTPTWDPGQYLRYGDERLRPALELLDRIDQPAPLLVHDVGCGTGQITRIMAERWPEARVVGSDTSTEMLAEAAAIPSRVEWQERDVREWAPDGPLDVVYSNAVLHWVPDHDTTILRLLRSLRPGGQLAIQMPSSWHEPSHRLMRQTLASLDLGSPALRAHYSRQNVATPEHYAALLAEAEDLDLWATRYYQQMTGDDPVLEWVKGTALRPILEELTGDARTRFLDAYTAELRRAYPPGPGGVTVYRFPRLFIVARR